MIWFFFQLKRLMQVNLPQTRMTHRLWTKWEERVVLSISWTWPLRSNTRCGQILEPVLLWTSPTEWEQAAVCPVSGKQPLLPRPTEGALNKVPPINGTELHLSDCPFFIWMFNLVFFIYPHTRTHTHIHTHTWSKYIKFILKRMTRKLTGKIQANRLLKMPPQIRAWCQIPLQQRNTFLIHIEITERDNKAKKI